MGLDMYAWKTKDIDLNQDDLKLDELAIGVNIIDSMDGWETYGKKKAILTKELMTIISSIEYHLN